MATQGIVSALLPAHILGGVLALVFGYVALFAAKGASVHRKSGIAFVVAMVAMSLSGAFIAFLNGTSTSVVAGLMTFYFVTTALLTVKHPFRDSRSLDVAAMIFAVAVAILCFNTGVAIARIGRPEAIPMFIFGGVGILAAFGDLRMIRAGGMRGSHRISRHLWRMCFAMWVAAASFFWGPPNRMPEIIRIPALLPIPVLMPIGVMFYWLWRIRRKRPLRAVVTMRTLNAAADLTPSR